MFSDYNFYLLIYIQVKLLFPLKIDILKSYLKVYFWYFKNFIGSNDQIKLLSVFTIIIIIIYFGKINNWSII